MIIHSFHGYRLSTYTMPGTVLGAKNAAANKTDQNPSLTEMTFYKGWGIENERK